MLGQVMYAQSWRSNLYPEDWTPGYMDSNGRFLHDFSYAGYKMGLEEVPYVTKNVTDITKSPYNADNTGQTDVTEIITTALNNVGKAGGGVVYLPAGTYKIAVNLSRNDALRIQHDNVILRGAGSNQTFLVNTTTNFRGKQVIYITGPGASPWDTPVGNTVLVSQDIPHSSVLISLSDVSEFNVGDMIILTTDCTPGFLAEHQATGFWNSDVKGQRYCRIIKAIDVNQKMIEIDIPTRYLIKTRDNARVYKVKKHIQGCGIEDLAIGNIQHAGINGISDDDLAFMNEANPAYELHFTHLITFRNVQDCWMRNVVSFSPAGNTNNIHLLSNAVRLLESKNITVSDCSFSNPQYRGGGGNGYMYTIEGNDCLISNCYAKGARHNYSFKNMSTHGNVIHRCIGSDPRYSIDFHMHLSMANLIDLYTSNGDYIQAVFRGGGDISGITHGYTTTESVIWNAKGIKSHPVSKYLIDSRQWGHGYVIGTSGVMSTVISKPVNGISEGKTFNTSPEDWVEGVGLGSTLIPQSLYEDQLLKRKQITSMISVIITDKKSGVVLSVSDNKLYVRLDNVKRFNWCKITDLNGKTISSLELQEGLPEYLFSIENLIKGMYIMQLYGETDMETRKFLKL